MAQLRLTEGEKTLSICNFSLLKGSSCIDSVVIPTWAVTLSLFSSYSAVTWLCSYCGRFASFWGDTGYSVYRGGGGEGGIERRGVVH